MKVIIDIIGFIFIVGFVSGLICAIKNSVDKQFDKIFKE